jgi:hypothetical protein
MRISFARTATVAIGLALLAAPAHAGAQSADGGVSAAAFMVGCWAQPAPEGNGLRETFAPPAANMLTGLSQFWRGGRIVDFEFHRIDASADGPVLTPHPRGVASVAFPPAEIAADRIVWQNLDHDFPQRIIYHRTAADTLVARIEGGEGETARALEWRMARVDCGT